MTDVALMSNDDDPIDKCVCLFSFPKKHSLFDPLRYCLETGSTPDYQWCWIVGSVKAQTKASTQDCMIPSRRSSGVPALAAIAPTTMCAECPFESFRASTPHPS